MYADRVGASSRVSIRERLYGDTEKGPVRHRQVTGKRQREDDKWEHDLYRDNEPHISNRRIGVKDLRLKLQKKSAQQNFQSKNESVLGVTDLREKLSGTMYLQRANTDPPKPKLKPVLEGSKPVRKTVLVEAPEPETKKVANSVPKKKTSQKAESVDGLLKSLGLEKYSIALQVEEVDMTALMHMTDEDLKALGIPMGPRKKIRLALESKV